MADNYLEKRMEDYRSGKTSHGGRAAGPKRGYASIKYPAQNILVTDADNDNGTEIIRTLVEAGNQVSFTAKESGRAIAQKYGGRFYPTPLQEIRDDLAARRQEPEIIVTFGSDIYDTLRTLWPEARIIVIEDNNKHIGDGLTITSSAAPSSLALLCLILAHKSINVSGHITVTSPEIL